MSGGWVSRAEAALGRGHDANGVTVLTGHRPPILDAEGIKAVLAPFMASLVWAAAAFREITTGTSLDPFAMLLRLVALGLTLRVILLGAMLARRFAVWLRADGHRLALTEEGLVYRSPRLDVAVPREQVIGVVERGRWQESSHGRRYADVYVVTDPASGRTHIALPPVFEDTATLLRDKLARWLEPSDDEASSLPEPAAGAPPDPLERPGPTDIASEVYDRAAKGLVPDGGAVVRHGREWIKHGPYAAVLVGVTAIEGLLRAGPEAWAAIDPLVGGGLVLVLLTIPARWLWMTRRDVAPRRGIAMVLTRTECLIATRHGMLRTAWRDLARVSTDAKRKWSVLEGAHQERTLVLTRVGAAPIRYDEPLLGIPVEAARALLDAYRTSRLPADESHDGSA